MAKVCWIFLCIQNCIPTKKYDGQIMTIVGTKNVLNREAWLKISLQRIPAGFRILDAGAGEQQYRQFCAHLKCTAFYFGHLPDPLAAIEVAFSSEHA